MPHSCWDEDPRMACSERVCRGRARARARARNRISSFSSSSSYLLFSDERAGEH